MAIIFRSCYNNHDARRQLFHSMSLVESRFLIFSCWHKQPSVPQESTDHVSFCWLGNWGPERLGNRSSQGYSSEESPGQCHGAECLPISICQRYNHSLYHIFCICPQLFSSWNTHDLVSAQQTPRPSCPLSNSVFPEVTGQSITSVELKLILQEVRLPMLRTWGDKPH